MDGTWPCRRPTARPSPYHDGPHPPMGRDASQPVFTPRPQGCARPKPTPLAHPGAHGASTVAQFPHASAPGRPPLSAQQRRAGPGLARGQTVPRIRPNGANDRPADRPATCWCCAPYMGQERNCRNCQEALCTAAVTSVAPVASHPQGQCRVLSNVKLVLFSPRPRLALRRSLHIPLQTVLAPPSALARSRASQPARAAALARGRRAGCPPPLFPAPRLPPADCSGPGGPAIIPLASPCPLSRPPQARPPG